MEVCPKRLPVSARLVRYDITFPRSWPQVTVLTLWGFGVCRTGHCGLTSPATFLGEVLWAEQPLRASLTFDPGSRAAINELQHISHVEAGGRQAVQEMQRMPDGRRSCEVCGSELTGNEREDWHVANNEGRVVYL